MAEIRDVTKDKALEDIADNCNKLTYVTSDSVGNGELMANLTPVAEVTLTLGDGNGDYTKGDYTGAGGGRKLTVAAKDVTASASLTAQSWVLNDGTTAYSSAVITAKAMTEGNVYESPEFVGGIVNDATAVTL